MKVCFLILHYNEIELTKKAVLSILAMDSTCDGDREIVIVDNCSPNDSGAKLVEDYCGVKENNEKPEYICNLCDDNNFEVKLHIVLNDNNGGFSAGNNVGYSYIKKNVDVDFIVALNNDITFPQKDFVSILSSIYENEETRFYLAGPDVYTPHIRSHISPLYATVRGIKETEDNLEAIRIMRQSFEKGFSIANYTRYIQEKYQSSFLLKIYNSLRTKQYSGASAYDEPIENCVLQGSCMIVDKRYIAENDLLFEEQTFMYAEEDFISYRLKKKGQKIRYCPELVTDHVGGGAAGFATMNFKKYCDKNIDIYNRMETSYMAYREYVEMNQ